MFRRRPLRDKCLVPVRESTNPRPSPKHEIHFVNIFPCKRLPIHGTMDIAFPNIQVLFPNWSKNKRNFATKWNAYLVAGNGESGNEAEIAPPSDSESSAMRWQTCCIELSDFFRLLPRLILVLKIFKPGLRLKKELCRIVRFKSLP